VRLRAEGRTRNRECRWPPIRLEADAPLPAPFPGGRVAHLTTHCDPVDRDWTPERMDERVIREFLAYADFERVAPVALRARLLRVTWVDPAGGRTTRPAFALEDFDTLAERTGTQRVGREALSRWPLLAEDVARFDAFQLFIDNQDFDLRPNVMHNALLLLDPGAGALRVVPFDFDKARLTWGERFSPRTWLDAKLCDPQWWRTRAYLPAGPALRAALLAFAALDEAPAEALLPTDSVAGHRDAFRALDPDVLLPRCFGLTP
jgi:hypothetical protein